MTIRTLLMTLSLLWSYLPFSMAHASVQVNNIKVNIKAESGLKARELAIEDARRKAFVQITQTNSDYPYDSQTKGMPSDEALERAADTFGIENEKISAKQYIGTLSVTFSKQGLSRLIHGHSSRSPAQDEEDRDYGETAEADAVKNMRAGHVVSNSDVVMLPITITSDESKLWQTGNPWYNSWQRPSQKEDAFKALIPLGDAQDIMAVSIEDIMTGQHQRVRKLLERYAKESLAVGIIKPMGEGNGELELVVKLFHKERLVFSSEPVFIEAATLEDGLSQAREALITLIQTEGNTAEKPVKPKTYAVTAHFKTFAQWQQIRRGLTLDDLTNSHVEALSRTYAKISFKSQQPFSVLMSAFSKVGLVLNEGIPGQYTLHVGMVQKPLPDLISTESNENVEPPRDLPGPTIRSAFEISQ